MKFEEIEKLRELFGKPVKVWHRAVSNVYYYEGVLLPFNQGRLEIQLTKDAETGHGFMKAGEIKSLGYSHTIKVEPSFDAKRKKFLAEEVVKEAMKK